MPARMILAMLVALSLLTACAQETSWEEYNEAGVEAQEQARYAEAEEAFLAALEEAKKFGDLDPRLAASLNSLAVIYQAQGKLSEAERLFQQTLAVDEKVLGPEHPDTATTLSNLAIVYGNQGKYAEAESLNQRALAIRENALGPEHTDVAVSLNNLALFYKHQGKYEEAEPLYQRSLAIKEKALGQVSGISCA